MGEYRGRDESVEPGTSTAMKLFCVTLQWEIHVINTFLRAHRLYASKTEPKVNYRP